MKRTMIAAVIAIALTLVPGPVPSAAAVPGYDSAYGGESAWLNLYPGLKGTFQVFFVNTGTTTWRKGTATQVNLGICLENKVSCNVPSANATWSDGTWLSTIAYATHTNDVVPGQFGAFICTIAPPPGTTSGNYYFNGDLVLGATGQQIHPEGYYQVNTIAGP